jgi:hypothetical protein
VTLSSSGPLGQSLLWGGVVPKNNSLKCAFIKLWNAYEKPLRHYVVAEKKKENATHRTPSLSLQVNGAHNQDHVAWGSCVKCPSNFPVCMHALMMPLQSHAEVNAANAWLRAASKANGGDGKFKASVDKSSCYCFSQNCFGDKDGIKCWRWLELAKTKSDVPSGEVAPGLCHFNCNVCLCNCQVTFDKCKHQTIANGVERSAAKSNKNKPIETCEDQCEGG